MTQIECSTILTTIFTVCVFSLVMDVCLGEGNFGVVHAAKLRDAKQPNRVVDVAVKRLKSEPSTLFHDVYI